MIRDINKSIEILLLLLIFLLFFGLKILLPPKSSMLDYPLLLGMVLLSIRYVNARTLYSKLISCYTFFVVLSCVFSHYVHGQNLFMVMAHSYTYMAIFFYFYLSGRRLRFGDAERVLIWLSVACCLCYIIQWIVYPFVLFQGAAGGMADVNTGYYRVRIPGSICCYVLFLYGFNKYLLNNRVKYLLYSFMGFLPIIIQGFRTLTTLSLISLFLMIPFVQRKAFKTIGYSVSVGLLIFVTMQLPVVQSKIDEMVDRQNENQTFSNKDYIRIKEFDYYWNEQFKNPLEKIIGGGEPTDPSSTYTKQIYGYAYGNHLFWDDLGLVGLSMIIGEPAVILLIVIYAIAIWRYREPRLQYLRFAMIIVLLGSFTTAELFREGNLLLLSLILYIEQKYHRGKMILNKDILLEDVGDKLRKVCSMRQANKRK